MVQLYVFNPAPKLRLLSTLFYRGSKRILGSVSDSNSTYSPRPRSRQCISFAKVPSEALRLPDNELQWDPEYHADSRKGFCTFRVENTLFNVHQVLLSREPSAFGDMLCLPQPFSNDGSDETPIFLTDTVQQFRDFLWALYAPPNDLFLETAVSRLLNVAELANKYCLSSLEAWTIEHIYTVLKDLSNPLRSASPEICGQILDVAALCNHEKLQSLITQHLISHTLWYNAPPDAVLKVAERHELRTLAGVCYYKQLVNMERVTSRHNSQAALVFPPSMDIETRMGFLAAHNSFLSLWESIRASPPKISCKDCPGHADCDLSWELMWFREAEVDEVLHSGSADILGRMKGIMLGLRKLMIDAHSMSTQCKLAALEVMTEIRDEVIDSLATHFSKTP